jgi:hypothetical protein
VLEWQLERQKLNEYKSHQGLRQPPNDEGVQQHQLKTGFDAKEEYV